MIQLLLLLSIAQAEELQNARKLFDRASTAYEASEFTAAIELFEQAYRIAPRPQIAFSLAQAYRRQASAEPDPGRRKQAIEHAVRSYRQYIDLAPQGSRRAHAEQFIAQLEQLLDLVVRSESAARTELIVMSNVASGRVSIDGREVALMSPIDVTPGKHVVAVEAPGYYPYRNEASIPEGRSITVDAELRPRPSVIQLSAPEGSEITVDGRPQGLAPLQVPLEVPAGRHFIAIAQRGAHPFARELDLEIGEEVRLVAELEPTSQRTASYVMMGLAGAFALGSAGSFVLAGVAQHEAAEIADQREMRALSVGEVERHNDLLTRRNRAFASAFGIGAGALVTATVGVLLFFFDHPRIPVPGDGIRF
jgi:tetratricopeptide (TPR) repeat protein